MGREEFDCLVLDVQTMDSSQKLELLKRMFPAPLQVVVGQGDSIVIQLNLGDREALADLLDAVSERLKRDIRFF